MLLDFDGPQWNGMPPGPDRGRLCCSPYWVWLLPVGLTAYGAWGLLQPRSEIRVVSEPVGAEVVINGWFASEAPMAQRLRPGAHKVVVRAAGYRPMKLTVALGAQPMLVKAKLSRRMPLWNEEVDH